MKMTYTLRYAWSDLWHSSNRPFSLINLVAISISVCTLVVLAGGVLAFRENSEKVMDQLGLRIEVSTEGEKRISEEQQKALPALAEVDSIYWWKPTVFLFYDSKGRLYDGLGGRTVGLDDPLMNSLEDIRNGEKLRFLSHAEMSGTNFDEIGIIVPFSMLKQLGYLPESALIDKRSTWETVPLPQKLQIRIKENRADAVAINVGLPIVGIVPEFEGGRYLVTHQCYQLLGAGWKDSYSPFITDRKGNLLIVDAAKSESPPPLPEAFPDTHASVYVKSRSLLIPALSKIRALRLRADSALEFYLQDYQQQETFFLVTAGGICLALFFFSGMVLFATFYALVLRKIKEIGILKAYGASSFLVNRLLAQEAVLLGTMAIAFGVVVGRLLGGYMSFYLQKHLQLQGEWFSLPIEYIGIIFAAGMGFCLVVTFIPVRMAVKIDPDRVMRVS